MFKISGPLDIQTFEHVRANRYSKLSGCSIFKLFGPLDNQKIFGLIDIKSFRAAWYSSFSGHSIFKLCGLLGVLTCRAGLYSKFSVCWIFSPFGPLDIQRFRPARYSNFSRLQVDIQSFRAARYSNFSGCSTFIVFELLDILSFGATQNPARALFARSHGRPLF